MSPTLIVALIAAIAIVVIAFALYKAGFEVDKIKAKLEEVGATVEIK